MTTREAERWMAENIGTNDCDVEIISGVTTAKDRYVDAIVRKDEWEGEITVTYWVKDKWFEIVGKPNGAGVMEEANKTAVIDEVDYRIALFDEAAEETKSDMEANYISHDNREYGSIAVAW